jgi:hypothetical protein
MGGDRLFTEPMLFEHEALLGQALPKARFLHGWMNLMISDEKKT